MNREQVAHELRTPLTTIRGVLQLIAEKRLAFVAPEVVDDLVRRAVTQVTKLQAVIDRVETEFPTDDEEDRVIVLYEEAGAAR